MPIPEPGWEDEGRRLSPLVDALSAVVIVGADTDAAAHVALGLAQAQAMGRRVVIGDLVGELEALEAMIPRHDPHGLADSFTYGISLNRIGYPVTPGGNLYIMPGGSEPVATELVIGHPRWQRLVSGFREVGALLILVAHPAAPALDRLVSATDGAFIVGDTRLEAPIHVIARARPRGPELVPSAPAARAVPATATTAAAPREADADGSGRRIGLLIAVVVGLMAILLGTLLVARNQGWGRPADDEEPAPAPVARAVVGPAADPPPPVENPEDSASAAAYSVIIVAANTAAGANDNLQRIADVPAATASPAVDGGALWYKVFVGAFAERAGAEAFRDSLRQAGRADETVQRIVALPFAFLVADRVVPDSVAALRAAYGARALPVYALMQPDGSARVYAGAFATPEEAMHLAPVLRSAGVEPRIVYRTGRSF